MSSTTLFVIRHGQTDWNREGRLQGHADIPLNAKGIEQAQRVAHYLKEKQIPITALYSSDLQRAQQTAHEIAKLYSLHILLSADLREGDFGKLQGLTKQEMIDKYGKLNYEYLPDFLQAEPRHLVVKRIKSFLTRIAQKHKGQHIAIVTHGAALGSLLVSMGHNLEELPVLTNESIVTLAWLNNAEDFVFQSIEYAV